MRLIDADALEKELCPGCDYYKSKYANCDDCAIANAPTIDAEPVVRCEVCKHYIPSEEIPHRGWCDDALQDLFEEDFYCGFGERREP